MRAACRASCRTRESCDTESKIESTLNNARRARELVREYGSLGAFVWSFEPDPSNRPRRVTKQHLPAWTPESVAISKALKARGWTFVGPTTSYALMQAMGMVNDHLDGCAFRPEVEAARARFRRPGRRSARDLPLYGVEVAVLLASSRRLKQMR